MKLKKYLFTAFITIFIASCASTAVISNSVTSETLASNYDSAWSKVIRFFSTNQIGIGTLEKESGIVTIKGENLAMDVMRQYCIDAGKATPFLWTPVYGTATGSVTLVDEGGFVTANVNVSFSVTSQYGAQIMVNRCASSGEFENSLLETLRS